MTQQIEMKEIKGVTAKLIATLLFGTITITCSVMGTYFSLRTHMDENKVELNAKIDDESHKREMDGLQMKEMRIRLDALEIKVERMNDKTQTQ